MSSSITSTILPAVVAATAEGPANIRFNEPEDSFGDPMPAANPPPPIGSRASAIKVDKVSTDDLPGHAEGVSVSASAGQRSPVAPEEGILETYKKNAISGWEKLRASGKKVAVVALIVLVAIVLAATGNYAFAAVVLTVAIFTGLALYRMHRQTQMTAVPLPPHPKDPTSNPQGLPVAERV